MKELRSAISFATALGAALSIFIADSWKSFADMSGFSVYARAAGQIVIVGLAAHLAKEFATAAVSSWPLLRRVILGRRYFEGVWFDGVVIAGQPPIYGISWIEPDGASVKWFAFNHSDTLQPAGFIVAELISVEWPRMFFKYKVSDDSSVEAEGFGQLLFEPRSGGAEYYHGFCVDRRGPISTIFGHRIRDEAVLRRLSDIRARPDELKNAAAELARMIAPQTSITTSSADIRTS